MYGSVKYKLIALAIIIIPDESVGFVMITGPTDIDTVLDS